MAAHVTKQKVAGPVPCELCDLQKICRVLQLTSNDLPKGRVKIVQKGGTVYRAGDPVEYLYTVRQGLLRSVTRDANRKRRVAVHIPGEALGVSAIETRTMAADIVAVTPAIYCALPLSALTPESFARFPQLAAAVSELQTTARARRPASTRGTLSHRVREFFTNISARLAERGLSSEGLECDIPREELADHFGRTREALERALEDAAEYDAIHLQDGKVTFRHRGPVSAQSQHRNTQDSCTPPSISLTTS